MTEDERAELERLRAENAQLKSKKTAGELTFKISEKGGLSVYGLGRFPVTLYKEQWRKLLGKAEERLIPFSGKTILCSNRRMHSLPALL